MDLIKIPPPKRSQQSSKTYTKPSHETLNSIVSHPKTLFKRTPKMFTRSRSSVLTLSTTLPSLSSATFSKQKTTGRPEWTLAQLEFPVRTPCNPGEMLFHLQVDLKMLQQWEKSLAKTRIKWTWDTTSTSKKRSHLSKLSLNVSKST